MRTIATKSIPTLLFLAFLSAVHYQPSIAGAQHPTGAPESPGSLAFGGSRGPVSSTRSAAVPFDQLGTAVGKQYSGDGLALVTSPDGARLRCRFQRLDAQVTKEGLWLTSTVDGSPNKPFRVRARTVGRAEAETLPSVGRVEVAGNLARWLRPELTEEFSVSVDGIRQDFVIEHRPNGMGPVRVELEVNGAEAESMTDGARLTLSDSGRRKLVYHRLKAEDKRGRELPVRMEVVSAGRVALVLDDAAAEYPVRIDPTFSDSQWISLGGVPGTDGVVEAAVVDGNGHLYIGGTFDTAGAVAANFVAEWNGSEWLVLGSGMNDVVDSLAVAPDGSLYAGGSFTIAGGVPANAIAKWNGSEWSALGSGITAGYPFTFVHAIAVAGETVYAGGLFTLAGGRPANFIAQWNGTSWSAVGVGMDDIVYDLIIWNGDLYAGGSFKAGGGIAAAKYIARWDGDSWSALGGGLDYGVNAMVVWEDNLYVGGNFNKAVNSVGAEVPAHYVAQWNGTSWSTLGAGLNNTVVALAVSQTGLYVGGIFTAAGGGPASSIAHWNGTTWSALGSGIQTAPNGARDVKALAAAGDILYVGGHFLSAGGASVNHIARWDGTSWSGLGSNVGLNNTVTALAVSESSLYAGGRFTSAGGVPVNYIAHWNGSSWSNVGLGLNGFVNALASSGSNVYVGGSFTFATNRNRAAVYVSGIARWNGKAWSALGFGVNSLVHSLAVSDADLFVGGDFTQATNPNGVAVPVNCIARWTGNSWSALGAGLSGSSDGPFGGGPTVRALAVSGDDVYAGGRFKFAGASAANNIAKWNGTDWSALGLGTSDNDGFPIPFAPLPVMALAISGDTLYAGGGFIAVGNPDGTIVPANSIAAWDGSSWSALDSGVSGQAGFTSVRALAVSPDGNLYAAGLFTLAGGIPANLIAQWDGAWSPLGSGISGNAFNGASVSALTISGTSLFAGGTFTRAGTLASTHAAQLILGPPSIVPNSCRFVLSNGSGQFGFDLSGGALQRVVIEASTNLSHWLPLQTNLLSSRLLHVIDPSVGSVPARFYRARQEQ